MGESALLGLRFLLAIVLLTAALPKLRNRADFEEAVENYRLLPRRLVPPFARWLPRVELMLGLSLLVGLFARVAAGAAAAVLVVFATAVAANLARGREIDCGCLSSSSPRRITWRLVVADVLLATAAVTVAISPPGAWAIVDLGAVSNTEIAGGDAIAMLIAATCAVVLKRLFDEWLRLHAALGPFDHSGGIA